MFAFALGSDMRLIDQAVLQAVHSLETPASQQELADTVGCTERTIRRSLKRLRELGFVNVTGGGNRHPYSYQVNLEALPDDVRDKLERE